jgi:hypothetical protein
VGDNKVGIVSRVLAHGALFQRDGLWKVERAWTRGGHGARKRLGKTHVAVNDLPCSLRLLSEYEQVVEEIDAEFASAPSLLDSSFSEDVALAEETGWGSKVEVLFPLRASVRRSEWEGKRTNPARHARQREIVRKVRQLLFVLMRPHRFVNVVKSCFGDLKGATKSGVVGVVEFGVAKDLCKEEWARREERKERKTNLVNEERVAGEALHRLEEKVFELEILDAKTLLVPKISSVKA